MPALKKYPSNPNIEGCCLYAFYNNYCCRIDCKVTVAKLFSFRIVKISHFMLYYSCYRPQTGTERGCLRLEMFASFIVTVLAGVTCHYVIKWLDGNKQSVTSLWGQAFPLPKLGIEKPLMCGRGLFVCRLHWIVYIFLSTDTIAYANFFFKILNLKI